jgi:hypothetical protein
VLSKTRNSGARRNGAIPPARHHQFAIGPKLEGYRCAARIAQLFAAAGCALWAGSYVMFRDGQAHQIEAYDVIMQVCSKAGGDRLCDLDGGQLDSAAAEHALRERRCYDTPGRSAVEQRLDLPIPFHPLGKTDPAGSVARAEHRTHQRKNARGLNEQPTRAVG